MPYPKIPQHDFGRTRMEFNGPNGAPDPVLQSKYDALYKLGAPGLRDHEKFDITNWRDLNKLAYVNELGNLTFPFKNDAYKNPWDKGENVKAKLMKNFLEKHSDRPLLVVDKDSKEPPRHLSLSKSVTRGGYSASLKDTIRTTRTAKPERPNLWVRAWHSMFPNTFYKERMNAYNTQLNAYNAEAKARETAKLEREALNKYWANWETEQKPLEKSDFVDSEKVALQIINDNESLRAGAQKRRMDLFGPNKPAPEQTAKAINEVREASKIDQVTVSKGADGSEKKIVGTNIRDQEGHRINVPPTYSNDDYALVANMAIMLPKNAGKMSLDQIGKAEYAPSYMAVHSTEDINKGREGLDILNGGPLYGAHLEARLAINEQFYDNNCNRMGRIVANAAPLMTRGVLRSGSGLSDSSHASLDTCMQLNDYLDRNPDVLQNAMSRGLTQNDLDALKACRNLYEINDKAQQARLDLLAQREQDPAKCRDKLVDIMTANYTHAILYQNDQKVQQEASNQVQEMMTREVPGETAEQKAARIKEAGQMMGQLPIVLSGTLPMEQKSLDRLNNPDMLRKAVENSPLMKEIDRKIADGKSYQEIVGELSHNLKSEKLKVLDSMSKALPMENLEKVAQNSNKIELDKVEMDNAPRRSINEVKMQADKQPELKAPTMEKAGMGRHSI